MCSVDGPRNTRNTRKGEEPTAPDRRNPGQVIFLLSLLSARIRVIRGFFIRVIRVIRGVRREKVWSFRGCNPHPVAGRNSRKQP